MQKEGLSGKKENGESPGEIRGITCQRVWEIEMWEDGQRGEGLEYGMKKRGKCEHEDDGAEEGGKAQGREW